jgi:Na+/H+-dicarboxylate symporter
MASKGAKLAKWTIGWYIGTTIVATTHSIILTALVWQNQFRVADEDALAISEADQAKLDAQDKLTISETVVDLFNSFVSDNIVNSFASTRLLAVLVMAVVVGWLLKPNSAIMRGVYEVEELTTVVIAFLIKCAPIGVFSLILSNLVRLDMASMGINLGLLIGTSLAGMFFHLFVLLPAAFFAITRTNPYTYWFLCAPSWLTAWGSSSSAGTMPVTLKVVAERGVPKSIYNFSVPLGTLINMDG